MSSSKRAETLHIPEARFVLPDGSTQLVQPVLAGTEKYLRPGRVPYDHEKHHLKLLCPYCDVRVDFNNSSGASCGVQIEGPRSYFRKAPKQDHAADCKLPHFRNASGSLIDKTAPYRVHLNMLLGGRYDPAHPVYERTQGGRIVAHDARLRPEELIVREEGNDAKIVKIYKESVSIRHVRGLHDLIRRGSGERLKNALVVHNAVDPWQDFAIMNKGRLAGLMDRLMNGASHPVLLHVHLNESPRAFAEGERVFYKRDEEGARFIVPRLYMDGPGTRDAMPAAGDYLVVGMARASFNERSRACFLNISVKNPDQVMAYSPAALLAEARTRAARQQTASPTVPAP